MPRRAGSECAKVLVVKEIAAQQLIELKKQGFVVFVNLCDGAWDESPPGTAGSEVVDILERLNVSYTGVDKDKDFYV